MTTIAPTTPAGRVLALAAAETRLVLRNRTLLVSSHQLAELAQTVDDVIVIDRGRLVARGSTAELMGRHQSASLEELFLDLVSNGTRS